MWQTSLIDAVKTPVVASTMYLTQVLPDPGKETKARRGRLPTLAKVVGTILI